MKFAAVFFTLLGIWIGAICCRKFRKFANPLPVYLLMGTVSRILIMTVLNATILLYFLEFLKYAEFLLGKIGLQITGMADTLLWTLLFTAIFNILHAILSMAPSYVIIKSASNAIVAMMGERPRILETIEESRSK